MSLLVQCAAGVEMEEAVPRPFLTIHVFGSEATGKTTLKTQWFDSSQCSALSEVADVHIRIQVCVCVCVCMPRVYIV